MIHHSGRWGGVPRLARAGVLGVAALGLLVVGPGDPAASAPKLARDRLSRNLNAIAANARPGRLGVAVKDLASGATVDLSGDRPMPMQSVFKAPLGACVLDAVCRHHMRLDSTVVVTAADLSPPYSTIGDAFPERTRYTIDELLIAAVGESDNTAADMLLKLIGGPQALDAWLERHKIDGIQVDRYERELQQQISGMPPFRPEWKGEQAWLAAREAVPITTRLRAQRQYLVDDRDMITALGAVAFLDALATGKLLPKNATAHLLDIMTRTPTGRYRLKAGLPEGATIAHKTGSGRNDLGINPAANDIGIVTLPGGRRVIIASLLSGSNATESARDSIHADVARCVIDALE